MGSVDVPLAAYRTIVDDTQYVDVWFNSQRKRVEPPFLPYYYRKEKLTGGFVSEREVEVRPLSTLKPERWWKYTFRTVEGVSETSRGAKPLFAAENHVPFVERILIDEPDWYRQFPNTDEVRILVLDVEQLSEGGRFPTEDDPLISIGMARNRGDPVVHLGDGESDRDLLLAFEREVREYDPDVLVGYNIHKYDLPILLSRLRRNGLDPSFLSRGGGGIPRPQDDRIELVGRLVYDVFDSVKLDQTLYGIKDLKLKTVGEWMKFPVVREDVSNTRALVQTERLREYNANDVQLTRSLSKIYWPNSLALAEIYGAPLNLILRSTPAFHTTILQGRVFFRSNPPIVSDGKNEERYRDLYEKAEGQAFVGGIVEIYQRGLFRPVWKIDFSAMYPSIMVTLGTGADNTRIVGEEPLGEFRCTREGEVRILSIPDESRKINHRIEIRGKSPLSQELSTLLKRRLELKKEFKETKDEELRSRLHARQNALKVILNSIYGVMASPQSRYGSLPVAIATVGVARRLIRSVEDLLGDSKIETDTDGVYSSRAIDVERINEEIQRIVERELHVTESVIRVEGDSFEAGYFHEKKSYLLLHHDGRVEKHGVAFKASRLCGVFDKTLDRVSRALLSGEDVTELARGAYNLDEFSREDFIMRVRMGKNLDEYEVENAIAKQMAKKFQERYGRWPSRGEPLEYIKTRSGFDLPTEEAFRNLDREYYRNLVRTALGRLGIDASPLRQKTLFDF